MVVMAVRAVLVVLTAIVAGCSNDAPSAPVHATPTHASMALPASPAPMAPSPARSNDRAAAAPLDDAAAEPRVQPSPRPMSRRAARELVERVVTKRLGRELAPAEAERLTDTVIRLRTATQTLRAAGASGADPGSLREERAAMLEALDDLAKATGLPPSEIGITFATDDDTPR